VDPRRFDTAHVRDRTLELAFESTPVIDALREVRHPPGRLIEQLEPGTALLRQAVPRQGDAGTRQVRLADLDFQPAASETIVVSFLIQLRRHCTDVFERHRGQQNGPVGGGRIAGNRHDEKYGQRAGSNDHSRAAASVTLQPVPYRFRHHRQNLSVVRIRFAC
jgi:hypothetical protein